MKIYQPKDYKGNKLVSEELLASKNYATKGEVEQKADQVYVDGELIKKADAAALEAHTSNNGIHVTLELKEKIDNQYSKEETDALIASKAEQSEVDELTTKVNEKVDQTDFDELSDKVDSAVEDITSLQEETAKLPDITREIDSLKESKADQTALEQAKEDLQQEIANRTESMFHYKGSVDTRAELEEKQAEAQKGDVWNVEETDANYVWTGTDWDKLNERHDGLTNKKDFDNHVANTDIHVQPNERETWNDKYTKEETNAELAKKADNQTVESLQSTVTKLTERTETLESANDSTTEKLETLLPKDTFETYKSEAESKFATKDEVSDVNGELNTVQSTVGSLQAQVTDLESSKAEATDLTKLTERVTKHEKDALKAGSTFTFIPLVSTDCEEAESVECTGFTLANHLLTPGTISTLTLPGVAETNVCCNLFVSSDGVTWVKLGSSSTVEEGTWTFDTAILPANLHLRCVFTESEITDGNIDGDTQVTVNVKKSKPEDTDKISAYAHDSESTPGVVCVTITFQQETSESVKEHITDGTKHLTENEKRNVQTLFSGYNGYSTLGDIEKKLNSAATNANLESLRQEVTKKADQSALTKLTGKVNKKAEQSALDTLKSEVDGKASSTELAQVQADLADKASQSDLTKVQDELKTKATTTALESAKSDLERQLGNKAESAAVELLQTKVNKLESATIEQTIKGKETSENAASAKAVADYVKSAKDELTTQIETKADGAEFKKVSEQVTENKGKLEGIETVIGTLAGGSDVTALQKKVDELEQNKVDNSKLTEVQQTLESSIATNKQSIDDINEQIDTMSQSIGDHLTELDGKVDSNTTALADKVENTEYQAKVTELEGKIDGNVSTEDFNTALEKKADKEYVDEQLKTKASATDLQSVQEALQTKATQDSVNTLTEQVETLETSDTEIKERLQTLEGKKDPEVDQTYKSQSENAQSGKAVAAGIAAAVQSLATQEALESGLETKANAETVTKLQTKVDTVETTLTEHTKNEIVHIKDTERTKWNAKAEKSDLTDLEQKLTQTIESKVGSVFHWKGTVEAKSELEDKKTTAEVGDVWNVKNEGGANYVWSGPEQEDGTGGWDKLSEDLTGYATSKDLTEHIADGDKHPSADKQAQWDAKADNEDITKAVEAAKTELDGKIGAKADKSYVDELTKGLASDAKISELSDSVKAKLDTATYEEEKKTFATKTELESKVDRDSLTEQLTGYVTQITFNGHVEDSTKHPSQAKQDEWDAKIDTAGLSLALEAQESTFTSLLGTKANQKDLTTHTENKDIHVETTDKTRWDGKLDETKFTEYQQTVTDALAGKADTGAYDEDIESLTQQVGSKAEESELTKLSEKVDGLKIPEVDQEYNGVSQNAQSGTAVFGALKALKETLAGDLTDKLSGYATTSALQAQSTTLNSAIEEAKTTASTTLTTHINDEKKHPSKEKQEAWDAKVDETQLTEAIEDAININNINVGLQLNSKTDNTEFNKHKTDETIHVTSKDKDKWNSGISESEVNTKLADYTKSAVLEVQLADKVSQTDLTEKLADKVGQDELETALESKAEESELQDHIGQTDIHVTSTEKKTWGEKVDTKTLNGAIDTVTQAVNAQIATKANSADLTKHTSQTEIHVGTGEKAIWNAKADQTWVSTQISTADEKLKGELEQEINTKADSSALEDLEAQLADKAEGAEVMTLQTEVADVKKSIAALEAGTVQIDNTYEPDSEHAISGKGVANALEGYATTGSVSGLTSKVDGFQSTLDGKAESSKVTQLEKQLETKLDEETLTEKLTGYVQSSELDDITQQLDEKASTADLTDHEQDETIHFTEGEKEKLKKQVSDVETGLQSKAESSDLQGLQDDIEQRLTIEDAVSTYAKKEVTDQLTKDLAAKASDTALKALEARVEEKVDEAGLSTAISEALAAYTNTTDLDKKLELKADKKDLETLQSTVDGKLDSAGLEAALSDYVKSDELATQLENKANSSDITDLREELDNKVDSTVLDQKLGDYVKNSSLTVQLAGKADKSELENYVEQTEFDTLSGTVTEQGTQLSSLQDSLNDKIGDAELTKKLEAYTLKSTFDSHTKNETKDVQHVTQAEKTGWNEKVDQELLDNTVSTGDNAVKEELRKEIKKVQDSIPTVDKVYTDEETFNASTNAQSGVSVKGALDDLHTKLLEELTGGDISLDGYATTEALGQQKTELEDKITKAQTAANAAQTTADSATTAAETAQSTADTAQSNLTKHEEDSTKHITATERQQWNEKVDTSALTQAIDTAKQTITQAYQDEIKKAVGSVFKWKGTVDDLTDLENEKETAQVGDVWNVKKDGANYVWSGAEGEDGTGGWDKLSENLEGFATTEKLTEHTGNEDIHFKSGEKLQWDTTIKGHTSNLTTLNDQVSSQGGKIELLQQKDKELDAAIKLKANASDLADYALASALEELEGTVGTKATSADLTKHTDDTKIHFANQTEKSTWDNRISSNASGLSTLQGTVTTHTGDKTLHFELDEKETWESDISGAKTDISDLKTKTDTTNTELLGLKGTVEGEQKKLKEHIADVTVAHFDTTEKAEMKASIQSLETQMANKVEQSAIDSAVAGLATEASVTAVSDSLQELIDSIDNEWNPEESPLSEGPQTGVAVAGAVKEHEDKTDIHVTKDEKDNWATKAYVASLTEGLASDGKITALSEQIGKVETGLTEHKEDTNVHFTNEEEKTEWSGKLTSHDSSISNLSKELQDTKGKYETLEVTVKGIQSNLEDKADKTELDSKADTTVTDGLQTKLDEVEKKIPDVEETYNGETFAESTNVPTGEVVSDAIEAALTSYATSASVTSEITSAVDAAKTEVKEELTTQISTKASNTDLQNHIKDANAHFSTGEKDTLTKKVDTTVTNLEKVTAEVQEDKGKIEKLQTKDGELEKSITSNSTNIATLQGQVGTNTSAITALQGQISGVEGRLFGLDETWNEAESPESGNAQSGAAVKGAVDAGIKAHKEEAGLHTTSTDQTKWNKTATDLTALQGKVELCALKSQLEQYTTTEAFNGLKATVTDHTGTLTALQSTVDTKIDDNDLQKALTAYTTTVDLTEQLEGKVDTDDFQQLQDKVDQCETVENAAKKYATKTEVSDLTTQVNAKASQTALEALEEQLDLYATIESVTQQLSNYTNTETLTGLLEKKADKTEITTLEDKLADKVDNSTLTTTLEDYVTDDELTKALGDKVDTSVLTSYATAASVTEINEALEGKATTQQVSELESQVQENDTAITSLSETIETDYLTKEEAESTYLKITTAASTYLTISNAASTYATEAAFTALEKTVNDKLDTATFNSQIQNYVPKTQYEELQQTVKTLQQTVQDLQKRLTTLEGSAVTSTMVKHLAVYVDPAEAPELDQRDKDTLYLVGSGSK